MVGGVLETESQHPAHPAEQGVVHTAHLVMHGLHLQRQRDGRLKNTGFVDGLEGLLRIGDLDILARSSRWEGVVISGVVGGLRNDDRVLGNLENAPLRCCLGKHRVEVRKSNVRCFCRCRHSSLHPDLHDGSGIGAVAGLRVGCAAAVHLVAVARVEVIGRCTGRDRRRGIVVKDKGLAALAREVNHYVRPLR